MAILMIFEMTLSYQIVLPLMLAGVVAYFVSRAVAEVAMYEVTTVRERDVTLRNQLRHTVIRDLVRPADTVISTEATVRDALQPILERSDERRVGQGCGSTGRFRWYQYY